MNSTPAAAPLPPDQWPVQLGYDESGKLVEANLPDLPHLLVAGGHDWQRQKIFADWLAHALDPAPDRLPACLVPVATPEVMRMLCPHQAETLPGWSGCTLPEAQTLLGQIHLEMEMRFRDFARNKIRSIRDHRRLAREDPAVLHTRTSGFLANQFHPAYPREWLPLLIILIPDLGWLEASETAMRHLLRFAQLGRASGVHFIAASGIPGKTPLLRTLFDQSIPKLAFKTGTPLDARLFFSCGGAELLAPTARLYYPPGTPYPILLHPRP